MGEFDKGLLTAAATMIVIALVFAAIRLLILGHI